MSIALSSACFYPEILTEDSIKLMKNIGFDIGEIFLNTDSEYEEDFAKCLLEKCQTYDFKINSIHAFSGVFEPYLFDTYKRRQKDMINTFKKICKCGQILNAKYYTFHGMRLSNLRDLDINHIADTYNELIYIANENNIKLAQENVCWCMSSNLEFLTLLNEKCKYPLHYTLDIKQAYKSRKNPEDYINVMNTKLVNIHINDKDDDNVCLLPGKGTIDYEKLYCKIKEIGYNKIYTIEVYRNNFKNFDELLESKKYLQNILK